MKLITLLSTEICDWSPLTSSLIPDPDPYYGSIINWLEETGLDQLSINLMHTHTGEPFISFAIWDNKAVGKLKEYIRKYADEIRPADSA